MLAMHAWWEIVADYILHKLSFYGILIKKCTICLSHLSPVVWRTDVMGKKSLNEDFSLSLWNWCTTNTWVTLAGIFFIPGRPAPHLEWRVGANTVSSHESIFRLEEAIYSRKVRLTELRREHHGANLTCLAYNTNLTEPLSETVKLTLYCKSIMFLFTTM